VRTEATTSRSVSSPFADVIAHDRDESMPAPQVGWFHAVWKRIRAHAGIAWWLAPLGIVGALATLFVLSDVIEQHLFGSLSIGWRHAILTLWAAIITAGGAAVVYVVMRRQQRRLSDTAEQITRLIESCQQNPSTPLHFENPHRVHCRTVLKCTRTNCPLYNAPRQRCWQVLALNSANRESHWPTVDIEQCYDCEVYRRSCPDKIYELGESFNNLMFLLKKESRLVGRMRNQMVEKEKMVAIGQMASGIAHEVCNPLSSISSVVQMLKRGKSSASVVEQLELIETHIKRISGTVRQLVSLARPIDEQWGPVDIVATLDEVVRLICFDRRARNVDVVFSRPDPLPPTIAVRGQLQQVFLNLALNALDAMPDGGTLTIRARHRRGTIAVVMEDSGSGIPPQIGRRIMEPFFTTKEPGKGTGLGLSVSYGIVQKHGGVIDFESAVGEGTAFTVTLPILNAKPENHDVHHHDTACGR